MRSFIARLSISLLKRVVLIALIGFALVAPGIASAGIADDLPFHCYLTWQSDPTSTITVNFHTRNMHAVTEVLFDTVSHDGTPALYPFRVAASTHEIPGLNDLPGAQRFIRTAELTGLEPGGVYYFIAGSPDGGYTAQRSVRLPGRGPEGLRFIDGGDMAESEFVGPLLQAAAAESPQFALIGGDIAYEDGALANWALWDQWLDNWEAYMITPEGYTVPLILAIGNHEVVGGYDGFDDPLARAPFYFGLFAQSGHGFDMPRSAYFRRDFGPEATLLVLDSGHVTEIGGAQADWLEQQLAQLGAVDLRMAAYHVPMYPSHRGFEEPHIARVRDAWLPLFDAGGLDLGFEHHDHTLKRTKPLRENRSDPSGTVYLGDGCFGQDPRSGDQAAALEDPAELASLGLTENYLAAWAAVRNFWLIEVARDQASTTRSLRLIALDADAAVLDESEIGVEARADNDSNVVCIASAVFARVPGALSSLRNLRDARLLTSPLGAAFADAYYRLGRPIASWLTARPKVIDPIQSMAKHVADDFDPSVAFLAAVALVSVTFVSQRNRRSATGRRYL